MELKFDDLLKNFKSHKFTFTATDMNGKKYENLRPVELSYHDNSIIFRNCAKPDGTTLKGFFAITPDNLIDANFKDDKTGMIIETNQGIYDITFSF